MRELCEGEQVLPDILLILQFPGVEPVEADSRNVLEWVADILPSHDALVTFASMSLLWYSESNHLYSRFVSCKIARNSCRGMSFANRWLREVAERPTGIYSV